jgi:tRNA U34 5-carboxymethylaminomethyl modifying GTPase MnmE/TrmE
MAIVTPIPGTTRDVVREQIQLDAMPLHITDTAGLRETDDPVEQEGIRRTKLALKEADRHPDDHSNILTEIEQAPLIIKLACQNELLAEELRLAQQALGEIIGEFTADELLGDIFSSFCIGK